jgi:hypothetical protein
MSRTTESSIRVNPEPPSRKTGETKGWGRERDFTVKFTG